MFRGHHFAKVFVNNINKEQQEQEPIKAINLTKLKCENCGSNLSLSNLVNGAVKCQYCGAEYVQGDTQETKIKKVESDLCRDDSYKTEICNNHYVKLNIFGKERTFYISNARVFPIYGDTANRLLDGTIVHDTIDNKVEINLIEM